nr:hypothetical protein [Sorangium cellulosum]
MRTREDRAEEAPRAVAPGLRRDGREIDARALTHAEPHELLGGVAGAARGVVGRVRREDGDAAARGGAAELPAQRAQPRLDGRHVERGLEEEQPHGEALALREAGRRRRRPGRARRRRGRRAGLAQRGRERGAELVGAVEAIAPVLRQAAGHHVRDLRGDGRAAGHHAEARRTAAQVALPDHGARAPEGRVAGEQLEEDDAHGVEVGAAIDVQQALALLGRHVLGGPHAPVLGRDLGRGALGPEGGREAEVDEGHPPRAADEEVLRLDVAVHVPARVDRRERAQDPRRERGGLRERQRLLPVDEEVGQGRRVEVLHHDVRRAVGGAAVLVDGGHVGRTDARERRDLVLQVGGRAGPIVTGDLDRDGGPVALALGLEHDAEAAARHDAPHAVARDPGGRDAVGQQRLGVAPVEAGGAVKPAARPDATAAGRTAQDRGRGGPRRGLAARRRWLVEGGGASLRARRGESHDMVGEHELSSAGMRGVPDGRAPRAGEARSSMAPPQIVSDARSIDGMDVRAGASSPRRPAADQESVFPLTRIITMTSTWSWSWSWTWSWTWSWSFTADRLRLRERIAGFTVDDCRGPPAWFRAIGFKYY